MKRYYQPEIETASPEQIRAWQDERLVKQVKHVWDNVPYYRKKMEEKGVTPDDIKSTADLHKLPFLTKDDLREAYPYGLLAKPLALSFPARYLSINSSATFFPRIFASRYPFSSVIFVGPFPSPKSYVPS